MASKAILTGATGFVGSNLCRKLLSLNWEVSIIVRSNSNLDDISDIKNKITIYVDDGNIISLAEFMKNINADVVFHLASFFLAEHETEDIDKLIESNIIFGVNVLEAMKLSNTRLIINTGTSWQHFQNDVYNPVCLYAATKEAFENILEYYVQAENFRAITLKLFDTYGENDKRNKLINLLNKFAAEKTKLNMSPGEQLIDLVHIEDAVSAFIQAYDYLVRNVEIKHKQYGVSSDRVIQLKELIHLYEQITGKNIFVNWGGRVYRKREVMTLWKSFEKLPNWKCVISLEDGLKRLAKI